MTDLNSNTEENIGCCDMLPNLPEIFQTMADNLNAFFRNLSGEIVETVETPEDEITEDDLEGFKILEDFKRD